MKLTTLQVLAKLNTADLSYVDKPATNKGARGQLIETMLDIPNGSDLTDMIDGELKSFTVGETICVTQVKHCLDDIMNGVEFDDSKVGQKLEQVIYIGFSKDNDYLGSQLVNQTVDAEHYALLAEDYGYISAQIKRTYEQGGTLHTITGPNGLLQIRTKAGKDKHGNYTPLCYNGVQLKDKYMAFYLCASFGKEVIK